VSTAHPALAAALLMGALLIGAAIGAGAVFAMTDPDPSLPATDLPPVSGSGVLDDLPEAPVEVVAETVRLPAGFVSTHVHGGPTFNTVLEGEVVIREDGVTTRYEGGDFFFEPADFPHRITALSDARIHVLRLLPPGAPATTEVDPDEADGAEAP
jgi:quercetin dioxygenase-like cupin family protein